MINRIPSRLPACARLRAAGRGAPRLRVVQALALCVTVAIGLPGASHAEGGAAGSGDTGVVGASQRMAQQLQQQVQEIQTLLAKAESDRSEGRFAQAYTDYATALKSVPSVPATAELRQTIFARYQLGAMDFARQLADAGQVEDAQTVLKRVLSDARDEGIDPGLIRDDFRELLAQLRDPERYPAARTPDYLRRVGNVSEWLKGAEGAINLADFDTAHDLYMQVLNADPYNEAAARGLELVNRMITEYEQTAHDHTRARFIREIEQEWEMEVPPRADVGALAGAGLPGDVQIDPAQTIKSKMRNTIVPTVQFQATPLKDVLQYLSQRSAELDIDEADPTLRGINIVIDQSGADGEDLGQRPVSLALNNVPLDALLGYVTDQVGLTYRVDPFAVSVIPLTAVDDGELVARRFTVPPDFIKNEGAGADSGPVDPFAAPATTGTGTTLVRKVTAEEFLKARGIDFPPGASATFIPATNSLVVRNTARAISLIEALVVAAKSESPRMVMVEFRLISIKKEELQESSYDWLVSPFNVDSGNTFLSGGTTGNQPTRSIIDFPASNPGGGPVGTNPITAGLRSGDVKDVLTIDDVLSRSTSSPPSTVAPGVFGVSNVFGDPQFQGVWRALAQNKSIERLCESRVLVKPGQTASVRSVREFIYPTEYDPPEIPQTVGSSQLLGFIPGNPIPVVLATEQGFAVTNAHPTNFEMRELGKIMEVQPDVGADNFTVNLNISVDITDFIGFVNYGSPITQVSTVPIIIGNLFFGTVPVVGEAASNRILMPIFEAVRENTNVMVWDGATVVIGGFIGDARTDVEDKVPLLGDLPGVGRYFRSSVEDRSARALLLFVTVRILDPAGMPINDLSEFVQE